MGESKGFCNKSLVSLPKGVEKEGRSTSVLLGKSISCPHFTGTVLVFPSCRIYVRLEKIQKRISGIINVRN